MGEPASLHEVERPLVSVVVVTHGQWEYTEHALKALRDNTPPVYEVVIVDNASQDVTRENLVELSERNHVRVILNEDNVGFGPAVNLAATKARGRYLCLLNSDAFVEAGWLEPLLEAFERDPDVVAVVPEVLNIDGTLQEAGVLVSGDGRTIALGRGDDPNDFRYLFRRYVDYGSALCLLVSRPAFIEAGGFDPVYRIGYCEDVDLCFRLAESGWRVLYEPRSRVRHVGGASSNPERIEELIRLNTRALRQRWPARLSRRPPLGEWYRRPYRLVESRDLEAIDRVMVVDEVVPSEDGRSGRACTASLLSQLARQWPSARVTLLTVDRCDRVDDARWLLDRGVEVVCAPENAGDWFRDRLLHATVVVLVGAKSAKVFGDEIHRTQPQALLVYAMEEPLTRATAGGSALATHLRRAEMRELRRARSVWASSAARLRFASHVAPEAARFLVPEDGMPAEVLPGVMASLGMAPSAGASRLVS